MLLLSLPLLPHFLNDVYIIGLSRGFITWSIVDGQNTATVGITKDIMWGLDLLVYFLAPIAVVSIYLKKGLIRWDVFDLRFNRVSLHLLAGILLAGISLFIFFTKAIHLDPHLSWFTGYSYAPWFYRPEDGPLRYVLFNVYIAGSACLLEEALYRSFLINGLERVGMPTWKAASISLVVFSLIHLSGGASFVLGAFLVGGVYTLVYVQTRNILSLVVAHFLVDLSWVTGFDGVLSALISPYLS